MDEPVYFCATNKAMMAATAAWRKRQLAWAILNTFPTLEKTEVREVFQAAFQQWQDVCGLTFTEVAQSRGADIMITTGRIDGPLGVLAWSELPPGDDRQLTQKYDTGETFVIAVQPSGNKIDLLAVACHEIGHALGLDHAKATSPDLMAPTYAPGRRKPQPGDIARIVSLYGPPVPTAPAPPAPGAGSPVQLIIRGAEIVELTITSADAITIPGYTVRKNS